MPTDVFRALSDPTRRAILELLRRGSRTAGEIAEKFPVSWPTVSRHLGILRDAGLIVSVRKGQHIRYEIDTTVLQDVVHRLMGWLDRGGRHGR